MSAASVIEGWIGELPDPCTSEEVGSGFWYIRIPGVARRWIPVEIKLEQRSVKLTSHVIIEPDEQHADVFRLLLRHNHRGAPAHFSVDGREGVICLVARIGLDALDATVLDQAIGSIVDQTEATFRTILGIGFASRVRRGSG